MLMEHYGELPFLFSLLLDIFVQSKVESIFPLGHALRFRKYFQELRMTSQ